MTDEFEWPWDFPSEEERRKMEEDITAENCGEKLQLVREVSGMSRRELAKTLGVAESTIYRLERGKTLPTSKFMLNLAALSVIGHAKYSKMSQKERETISETIGAAGGVAAGVGASIGAISAAGAVGGLSAAGITSGLAAIGGSMVTGVAVVAAIPVAVGAAGFGLV